MRWAGTKLGSNYQIADKERREAKPSEWRNDFGIEQVRETTRHKFKIVER
jgi:hypothetical protein